MDEKVLAYVGDMLNCGVCVVLENGVLEECGDFAEDTANLLQNNIDFQRVVFSVQSNSVPLIFSWNGEEYFGVVVYEGGTVLIGPILFKNHIFVNSSRTGAQDTYCVEKASVSVTNFIKSLRFIQENCCGFSYDEAEIVTENFCDEETVKGLKVDQTKIVFDFAEFKEGHHPFSKVRALCKCIREGNTASVVDCINDLISSSTGITSDDALRNSKNMSIAGVTNMTNAAIEAGINYEQAYSLSDSIIKKIEQTSVLEELKHIYTQGGLDFANLVANLNNIDLVQTHSDSYYADKARTYVNAKMHRNITVGEIADALHISPNYLSAVFKKSTGGTLSHYIMREKVHRAKNLLCYSELSFSEIAFALGFASQSHFGEVFKRHTGISPKKYAQENKKR